jgi:hypothetical protein
LVGPYRQRIPQGTTCKGHGYIEGRKDQGDEREDDTHLTVATGNRPFEYWVAAHADVTLLQALQEKIEFTLGTLDNFPEGTVNLVQLQAGTRTARTDETVTLQF